MRLALVTLLAMACGGVDMFGQRKPLREGVNTQRTLGTTLAQYGPGNQQTSEVIRVMDRDILNASGASPSVANVVYLRRIHKVEDDTPVFMAYPGQNAASGGTSGFAVYRLSSTNNELFLHLEGYGFSNVGGYFAIHALGGGDIVLKRKESYYAATVNDSPAASGVFWAQLFSTSLIGMSDIDKAVTQTSGFPKIIAIATASAGDAHLGSAHTFIFDMRLLPSARRSSSFPTADIP